MIWMVVFTKNRTQWFGRYCQICTLHPTCTPLFFLAICGNSRLFDILFNRYFRALLGTEKNMWFDAVVVEKNGKWFSKKFGMMILKSFWQTPYWTAPPHVTYIQKWKLTKLWGGQKYYVRHWFNAKLYSKILRKTQKTKKNSLKICFKIRKIKHVT